MGAFIKVIFFCLLISLSAQQENSRFNPSTVKPGDIVDSFSRVIKNIAAKANRVETVKEGIKKWIFEGSDLNGQAIVVDLAKKLNKRLNQKMGAVIKIATAAEQAHKDRNTRKQKYHPCCKLPEEYKVTYDPRYKDKVTAALFCQMKAPAHSEEDKLDFSRVRTEFDKNKLKVKWQYFGSIEGVTAIYPSAHVSTCGMYDNRIRPWYVNTATPSPKNIVILMDSSTSMGEHIAAAKETTKIVVSTLNQQDKVSVILFNSSTFLRADNKTDECYNTTMASAGTFNIKYLRSLIDSAQPIGGTRFIRAFKKAFEVLKNTLKTSSKSVVSRPSMILLITDGAPNKTKTFNVKEQVLKAIKNEVDTFRKEYKTTKSFKLLTLQLGSKKETKLFLKKLVEQTDGIPMHMAATKKKDPYTLLKPYFDHLMKVTPAKKNEVVISPPYLDSWGLGLLVTAACPYFDKKNKLRGVAGVDIPMADLLSDVQYFNQAGPKSYAFLFHSETLFTLSHPKLPTPETINDDPNSVSILELEQGEEFKKLVDDVLESKRYRGRIFKGRKQSVSRGSTLGDGVKIEPLDTTYSCIFVGGDTDRKDYIVCVVLEQKDTGAKYKSLAIENKMSPNPVTYHRMDVLPEAKTCYYTDTISYKDRSVVKFSVKAFGNPPAFLEAEESAQAIFRYVQEMKGRAFHSQETTIFSDDAVVTAMLTSVVDETWFAGVNNKEGLRRFVRGYIGTYNGVLRLYPGAPLPTNFEHTTRPWFMSAVANDGLLSITAPYLDPLGAGFVVSLSQTIRSNYGKKNIFGVIGVDIAVSNFGAMFKNNIGENCLNSDNKLRCFLLDSNGYVVYHPNFDDAYNNSRKVINKHITEMDAEIAHDLISSGVMVKRECQNVNLLNLQRFYEIVMTKSIHSSNKAGDTGCGSYALVKVSDTNVFVVVKNGWKCVVNQPSCPCDDYCTIKGNKACECPCKAPLEYNFCNGSLTGESDIPVCIMPSPPVPARAPLKEHPDDIGWCFNLHCGKYKTEGKCSEIFGCFWCYKKEGGETMEPSCKSDRECYGGVLGKGNPFLLPHKEKKKVKERKVFKILGLKLDMMTLIAGSSGLGGAVLIAFVIIFCLCRRKAKAAEEEMELESMEMFGEDQPQLMEPVDAMAVDPSFAPLPLNYPGQSKAMQSNMQMRLGAPGMGYSTQAMSGMWSKAYNQSQLMSFVPQVSTMQTPGAYQRKTKKKQRPPKRKVSFSDDVPEAVEEDPEVSEHPDGDGDL